MLVLRPYMESDGEKIAAWSKDEVSFRKWCADLFPNYPVTPEEITAYYCEEHNGQRLDPVTICDGAQVVGHLFLRPVAEEADTVRLCFVIVDEQMRGKGYGKETVKLAMEYARERWQARRITLGVFENNDSAYYCYQSLGFREIEGKEKHFYRIMGEDWLCREMEYYFEF